MSFIKKSSFAVCAAAGEGCALLLTALLMLALAGAVQREALSQTLAAACAPAASGMSVLISTAVIARARGRQALATGGALALGYVLLAALFCALGGAGCGFGPWLAFLAAAVGAGGLAGGLLSLRRNRHKKRRR